MIRIDQGVRTDVKILNILSKDGWESAAKRPVAVRCLPKLYARQPRDSGVTAGASGAMVKIYRDVGVARVDLPVVVTLSK